MADELKNQAGALRQVSITSTKMHSSITVFKRCAGVRLSIYKKGTEDIMRDINSLKIFGNDGREDRAMTVEMRKKMFEKTFGDSKAFGFCESSGTIEKK